MAARLEWAKNNKATNGYSTDTVSDTMSCARVVAPQQRSGSRIHVQEGSSHEMQRDAIPRHADEI